MLGRQMASFRQRRDFLRHGAGAFGAAWLGAARPGEPQTVAGQPIASPALRPPLDFWRGWPHPLAIAMWDFSWLERRWPGAGYDNWARALDQLQARGYDALRIDPYPHLLSLDAGREWELLPVWNQQDWGSPALNRVRLQPGLSQFLRLCAARGLRVAFSSWFRQDRADSRLRLLTPADLGSIWKLTLDHVAAAGLLQTILYVDLCNEFPLSIWAPFLPPGLLRNSPAGARWMAEATAVVRRAYPQIPLTFSCTSEFSSWRTQPVEMLDFLELHIWMTQWSKFYSEVGYNYQRFSSKGYEDLVARGEPLYRARPAYWQSRLRHGIAWAARWSQLSQRPLMTTECWGVVDYKDWPLLDWGWVRELCEVGVEAASSTGRWAAMATSNFCGPQFAGMWRDLAWHRRLTARIHAAPLPA